MTTADSTVLSIFRRKLLRYLAHFHVLHFLTKQGLQNLYDRMERMATLGPQFIDVCPLNPVC